MSAHLTLADLRRWEDNGATWRALEIAEDHVTVQLCACTGEPVELAQGADPELVRYVRAHRASTP